MFVPYDYALQIKVTMEAMFKSGEYGIGVVGDTEFIEKNPFIPMVMVLGNFYNKIDQSSKMEIDDFFENYYWIMGKTIEEIGESKMKRIIKEFNHIVSTA